MSACKTLLATIVIALPGCLEDTSGRTDSQSHWLSACVDDSECGDLSCTCWVCADPCGDGGSCADDAVCVSLDDATDACLAPSHACVPRCEVEGCPNGGVCDNGECLPHVAMDATVPDGALTATYGGAFAATVVDGEWRRQCGAGSVDGVLFGLGLRSSSRDAQAVNAGLTASDRVDGAIMARVMAREVGRMGVTVTGVDGDPLDPESGATPAGYIAPAAAPTAIDAVLLVDQSGSMMGLIHEDTHVESVDLSAIPANFGDLASDRTNRRISFARDWVERMGPAGRVAAISFHETGQLGVPCSLATGHLPADFAACFGAELDVWLHPASGLDSLVGEVGERANLWQAVETARDLLRAHSADPARARQIVIISDGPDTCARGETLNSCEGACSGATTWEAVRQAFAADAAAGLPPIQVSVVQFEALGYPGPDARQLEVACATGGQYHFIPSNDFPHGPSQGAPLEEALSGALDALVAGARGTWELAVPLPELPVGRVATVQARLTLTPAFDVDELPPRPASQSASPPVIRVPCTSHASCGVSGEVGPCVVPACSPETLLCAAPNTYLPDTAACAEDGVPGFCCDGECHSVGGVCAACTAD